VSAVASMKPLESNTASIVSPCKTSLKKSHKKAAAGVVVMQQQKQQHNNTIDDTQFDFLDMMADGAGDNTAADSSETPATPILGAAAEMKLNQGRDSAVSTSLAFRHSPEMMVFPEVRIYVQQSVVIISSFINTYHMILCERYHCNSPTS
jgi:hypothetical protein